MTLEEPTEDAKCMAAENTDGNANKTNGRLRFGLRDKLRIVSSEQRQSFFTALLLVLLLVFFVIIIALAVKVNTTSSDLHDRCYSPECLENAAYIMKNMDSLVDPCDDFQKFACGSYLRKHPLNRTVSRADLLDEVRAKIRARTRQLIDEISPEQAKSGHTIRSHVSKFFTSCIDERAQSTAPHTTLIKYIRDMGGWEPIAATSFERNQWKFDKSLVEVMRDYGVFPFFKLDVQVHGRGGRTPMIRISPSGFGLGANPVNYDSLTKPFLRKSYVNFINDVVRILRENDNHYRIEDTGELLYEYESRLLKFSELHTRNLTRDRVVLPLSELKIITPNILWEELLGMVFKNTRINNQYRVIIENVEYFKQLRKVLSTSDVDLKSRYIMWHFVLKFTPFLGKEIRLLEAKFRAEIAGTEVNKIDHQTSFVHCLDLTNEFFGLGLAHLHQHRFHLTANKQEAERLLNKIPALARRHVKNVAWLKDSYHKVDDRLDGLNVKIGYPDGANTEENAFVYYRDATLNRDFFDNLIELFRLRQRWMVMAVSDNALDKKDLAIQLLGWTVPPLSLQPYYSYSFNQVSVPMGMLSQPIFSAGQNAGLQAAAIAVVAQEALKSIDRFGLQFSEHGAVADTTFEALGDLLTCLDRNTENELHSYGILNNFLEEAVSDIAGLQVALQMLDESSTPSKLPGLDFNARQLFYIGYGQLICANMADKTIAQLNRTLTRTPERLRLHRVLQQTPDFANAFGCSVSSRMVSREVCDVW